MGNIKALFCENKPEGHQCIDHEGRPNCFKVENMKFVYCEHLNAVIEGMRPAYVCLDTGKLLTEQCGEPHKTKKVWVMERE
jgi:hypothetical protein